MVSALPAKALVLTLHEIDAAFGCLKAISGAIGRAIERGATGGGEAQAWESRPVKASAK